MSEQKPVPALKIGLIATSFLSGIFAAAAQDAVWAAIWFLLGSMNLFTMRDEVNPPNPTGWWLVRINMGLAVFVTFLWMVVHFMGKPAVYQILMCLSAVAYFVLRLVEDSKAEEK